MKLTPEAGTMKTGKARTVPIHAHVIEQGFIEFVKLRGKGPLFTIQKRVTMIRLTRSIRSDRAR